jgi:hypothetical protein
MFECYHVTTKNMIESFSSEGVTFSSQARPREYLTVGDLFHIELLVVTISHTVLSMVATYANFTERTCNGDYTLINVTNDDRTYLSRVSNLGFQIIF